MEKARYIRHYADCVIFIKLKNKQKSTERDRQIDGDKMKNSGDKIIKANFKRSHLGEEESV